MLLAAAVFGNPLAEGAPADSAPVPQVTESSAAPAGGSEEAQGVILLVRRAASSSGEDYVRLRNEYLRRPAGMPGLQESDLGRLRDWRERIVARAWRAWEASPDGCRALWEYVPPRSGHRNFAAREGEAAYRRFDEAGETGLAVALEVVALRGNTDMELAALQGKTHHGALYQLLAGKRPPDAFDAILERALRAPGGEFSYGLERFGPEAGPRILGRLDEASPRMRPYLIRILAKIGHRPAVPKLGQILRTLAKEKGEGPVGSSEDVGGRYSLDEEDAGLAICYAFKTLGGATFAEDEKGSDWNTARIDRAKEWWENEGSKRNWDEEAREASPGPGEAGANR